MRKNCGFKRINCALLAIIVLITGLSCFVVPRNSNAAFNKAKANSIASSLAGIGKLKAKAYAAAHLDAEGGLVYTSENAYEHYSVGNMVKLMTLYLTFEAIQNGVTTLSSGIKVSKAAQQISVNRERVFLDAGKGEIISVQEAIVAICVAGANDACYALAEKISGTNETDFVSMMNEKAQELGLTNTRFMDSTGIKIIDDGQYSCAADMCMLSYHFVKNFPEAMQFTSQDSQLFHHTSTNQPDTQMNSSNALISLKMMDGVNGLIVGYSNKDKYAMAASAEIDGEKVVAVVIGEDTAELRAGETKYLLKYALDTYYMKDVVSEGTYVRMLSIKDGKNLKVKTCVGQDFSFLKNSTLDSKIESKIIVDGEIVAPVSKGDVVGSVVYEEVYTQKDADGNNVEVREKIGSVDLIIAEDMDRANWFLRLIRRILRFFGIEDY